MTDRTSALDGVAAPPRSNGELIFEAPWESRVFGMTAALCERGTISWDEFRDALVAEIGAWERGGDREPWCYYARWLAALERLLATKGLCAAADVGARAARLRARPAGHDHRH